MEKSAMGKDLQLERIASTSVAHTNEMHDGAGEGPQLTESGLSNDTTTESGELSALYFDAPYFKGEAMFTELASRAAEHGSYDEARVAWIERLKILVQDARRVARARLELDGDGRACAHGLSVFQDELIRLIYKLTITFACKSEHDAQPDSMAIVATGGYGRSLLAPGSDIDLLFLFPKEGREHAEKIAEAMLYLLWDIGFKVGHASRTIDECLKMAQADMTIRTSLLDSRLILGDRTLFEEELQRFRKEIVSSSTRDFIDAKMVERDERHRRSGDARYRVEPNIKDGKGGLRDLHTLHWLSNTIYGEDVGEATVAAGIFTEEEAATFRKCEDFLWTIRCHLHFLTGRAEERLTFEFQPQMAERLGYKKHGGQPAVERFMKHYFLVAKDVGDLTTFLCAALEIQQMKTTPGFSRFLRPKTWRPSSNVKLSNDFKIANDRIDVSSDDVFERDPINLIRLFAEAAKANAFLHPNAIRLIRRSLRLIDSRVRKSSESNRIFLELLTGRDDPADALRRMNDAGVLGRFIFAFRKVVGMMQFNMYHHYTVDEHLIRTVGMLTDIEHGGAADELPLSTEIFGTIQNRRALYVAAFLHDIGKGRKEDHSLVGARIARSLCPRLGLTAAETELVGWLIEEHLTMSLTAQNRDVSDPKTIKDFAAVVKTQERLKLLLLLTVADIRAVGPGTWNGWKGQLLRTLYYETQQLLAGKHAEEPDKERIAAAQATLAAALRKEGWKAKSIDAFIDRFYPDYWLRFDTDSHIEHAELAARASIEGKKLAIHDKTDAFNAVTELTILAPNHARLLSLFAGACAATGANILGAQITTTRDGFALDTFLLQRQVGGDDDEHRRVMRIGSTIERLLKGESRLKALLAKRRNAEHRVAAFSVEPKVSIDNSLSEQFSVIEVAGLDRPGLLYDLTTALADLNLDISSAHVSTFGEKAVDAFYVTDLVGKKIYSRERQDAIRERLEPVLRGEES